MSMIKKFVENDSGATAVEYGLIVSLIAVVVVSAVTSLGSSVSAKLSDAASDISK